MVACFNRDHKVCIAPMLKYTDRHLRYFLRLISKHIFLYSEMLTTGALLYGDSERFLNFNEEEHPVALQLGGNNPKDLAKCAKLVERKGYDEINLNVGCPSDRVQSGQFGVCLMLKPKLVANCIEAMKEVVQIPVTVKTRLGVDDRCSYDELASFIDMLSYAGCKTFIIHARLALLKKLNAKENRKIPTLHYEVVYQLKKDFPDLEIIVNGGILTLESIKQHLQYVDGVMLGQAAYQNPYLFAEVDRIFFTNEHLIPTRIEVVEKYIHYVEQQLLKDVPLGKLLRPLLGLFKGTPGARLFRQHLSENMYKENAGVEVIEKALKNLMATDI